MMIDCFKEKRINLKYKKGNMVYTICGWDYKRKLDQNPHKNLFFFCESLRLGDGRLVTISILYFVLSPQKT